MKQSIHRMDAPVIICNRKQGHYSVIICEMMNVNEIRYNPATSTFFLSVVGLTLKSYHTQNMHLSIE
jgi:hypothetical protein